MALAANRDARLNSESKVERASRVGYKLAVHRHTLIRRLFRIGAGISESKLLSFKKSLIKKAMLEINQDLDVQAIQTFKNIMSFMGDRLSSKRQEEHARKLVRNLIAAPQRLRDEAYIQLCKQTTHNPRQLSTIKGWQLMLCFISCFPPSEQLSPVLADFLANHVASTNSTVAELAKACTQRLELSLRMGARKQTLSHLELECLKENKPVRLQVKLVDRTFKIFNVDSFTLVQDVQDQLVQKYNLVVTAPFALYESGDAHVHHMLDPKDRVLDVYSSWNYNPLCDTPFTSKYNAFTFKARRLVMDANVRADPQAVHMMFLQSVSDFVHSSAATRAASDEDVVALAALQLQVKFGDFQRDQHVAGWLAPKMHELVPADLLSKSSLRKWEQEILEQYQKLSTLAALEAKLRYFALAQEHLPKEPAGLEDKRSAGPAILTSAAACRFDSPQADTAPAPSSSVPITLPASASIADHARLSKATVGAQQRARQQPVSAQQPKTFAECARKKSASGATNSDKGAGISSAFSGGAVVELSLNLVGAFA